MKKLLLLILIPFKIYSQSIGGYISHVAPVSIDNQLRSYKIGIDYSFKPKTSFIIGAEYATFIFENKYKTYSIDGSVNGIYVKNENVSFLLIPISYRYVFKGQFVNPYIKGGVINSFKLSNDYIKTPYILSAGFESGFIFNINNKNSLSLGASYNQGITTVNKNLRISTIDFTFKYSRAIK